MSRRLAGLGTTLLAALMTVPGASATAQGWDAFDTPMGLPDLVRCGTERSRTRRPRRRSTALRR